MSSPRYIEVLPHPALAPHVQCYWALEGVSLSGVPRRVLPDGCVDVLVDLDARVGARGRVVGAMQTAAVVPLSGRVSLLGVRFQPGAAAPFLRMPLDVVTDGDLPLEEAWGREGRELASRLQEEAGLAGRVRLLDRVLLAKLLAARGADAAVAHAVERVVRAGGAVPVRELRDAVGLSERTLERRFRAWVGVGPKVLCRVMRLQRVVGAASAGGARPDWARLALEAGYCDQAHLNREFKRLAGLSPGAWAREEGLVGFIQDSEAGRS